MRWPLYAQAAASAALRALMAADPAVAQLVHMELTAQMWGGSQVKLL
jgi:hypothetical protein